MLEYEWDPDKAADNAAKHDVTFEEASTVFLDALAITYHDPDHSLAELRFISIGESTPGRLLFVAHQELAEHRIRIVSARPLTKREAHAYKEAR